MKRAIIILTTLLVLLAFCGCTNINGNISMTSRTENQNITEVNTNENTVVASNAETQNITGSSTNENTTVASNKETQNITEANTNKNTTVYSNAETQSNLHATILTQNQKVLVINMDPVLESRKGIKLHQLGSWWSDPKKLSTEYISDFKQFTSSQVKYEIVEWIDLDEFPRSIDGFSYDDTSYLNTYDKAYSETNGSYWASDRWHESDGFDFDYRYYIKKYNIIQKINNNQIDEVWIFNGPCTGVGAFESIMVGNGAYWCNSMPLTEYDSRPFVIYNFNYERDVGCMLENAGHRMESIMTQVFGRCDYSLALNKMNKWEKFSLYDIVSPGHAACGNVHYAPNSKTDYDWGNTRDVKSSYIDWLNYPNLTNETVICNCNDWGNGDMREHHKWWFNCIPKATGVDEKGYYNNWWIYFVGLVI